MLYSSGKRSRVELELSQTVIKKCAIKSVYLCKILMECVLSNYFI